MKRININCDFSKEEYILFEKNCNFNKHNGEFEVYKLLKEGASIVKISDILHMSTRTVDRRIFTIKLKILKEIK